jgi:hypothetical protein
MACCSGPICIRFSTSVCLLYAQDVVRNRYEQVIEKMDEFREEQRTFSGGPTIA